MFERLARCIRHAATLLGSFPSAPGRRLLWRIFLLSRELPRQFDHPLPALMTLLTPGVPYLAQSADPLTVTEVRQLVDAVAACHFWSPLGICLRRSLLRYHFLRALDLPVTIIFGARLKGEREGGGLGGHAWLTLNGKPYYETPGDYEGFVEMYVYPESDGR